MREEADWNKKVIDEFRANSGKVGGHFQYMNLLLLHTTGAKSGLPRVNPLVYLSDEGRWIVIASKGGAHSHPDWYYNLLSNPQVKVEVGTNEFFANAAVAEEPERSELFAKMAANHPFFAEYERQTARRIPVLILTRTSE